MKLLNLLKENSSSSYEYGCVMIYFNFPELFKIQDMVNPDDWYKEEGEITYGMEDEPHCTLLYGLHKEVNPTQIRGVLREYIFGPAPLIANNASCFNNEKYDVFKFDLKGEVLYEINKDLRQFPYTNDYPDYHPHVTIGYIQKGKGNGYAEQLKGEYFPLEAQYVVYSQPNGLKTKIPITTQYDDK